MVVSYFKGTTGFTIGTYVPNPMHVIIIYPLPPKKTCTFTVKKTSTSAHNHSRRTLYKSKNDGYF